MNTTMTDKAVDQRVSRSQLERLITVAEESSKRVIELRNLIRRLQTRLIALVFVLYTLIATAMFVFKVYWGQNHTANTLSIAVSVISLVTIVGAFAAYSDWQASRAARRELNVERAVLRELLGMLFELRKMSSPYQDPVEDALLNIRLKRIQFSTGTD